MQTYKCLTPCSFVRSLLTLAIFLIGSLSAAHVHGGNIIVSSGIAYPGCGSHSYCETYGGHATYYVHYSNLPAGNYRITSAGNIVVDFDVAVTGSGAVVGNGGGDYFNNNGSPD